MVVNVCCLSLFPKLPTTESSRSMIITTATFFFARTGSIWPSSVPSRHSVWELVFFCKETIYIPSLQIEGVPICALNTECVRVC